MMYCENHLVKYRTSSPLSVAAVLRRLFEIIDRCERLSTRYVKRQAPSIVTVAETVVARIERSTEGAIVETQRRRGRGVLRGVSYFRLTRGSGKHHKPQP